jgi:hypothetical protein
MALVFVLHHAGDAAPLASPVCGSPLELSESRARSPTDQCRGPGARPAVGAREPSLGLPADRRRARRARDRDLGDERPQASRRGRPRTCRETTWRNLLARVHPSSGAEHGRLRVLHRRHGCDEADLRALLHRGLEPSRPFRRNDREPRWGLGDSAGAKLHLGSARTRAPPALLAPRQRRQVQRRLRRGLPRRGHRSDPNPCGSAEGQRDRRALRRHRAGSVSTGSWSSTADISNGFFGHSPITTTGIDRTAPWIWSRQTRPRSHR